MFRRRMILLICLVSGTLIEGQSIRESKVAMGCTTGNMICASLWYTLMVFMNSSAA